MSLYPTVCRPCATALRASAIGRYCPSCGELFPSRDRELRAATVRNEVRDARSAARAALTQRSVGLSWEQLALWGAD